MRNIGDHLEVRCRQRLKIKPFVLLLVAGAGLAVVLAGELPNALFA